MIVDQLEKKWWQKDWFVIFLLFLFWPIGLYLMYSNTSWPYWLKISITLIILIFFFLTLADVLNPLLEISRIVGKNRY